MEQNKIKSMAECKKAVALQQGYDSFEQWTASLKVSGGYKAHERLIDEANALYYSPENQQPTEMAAEYKDGYENYVYAVRLAQFLRKQYYPDNKEWEPLKDLMGVLSQIDNMIVGINKPAQPVEGDLEKVIKEIIDYGNAGKTVSSTDSHVSYLGKKCLKLLEQHQQPSAVQWLTDGDINKIFYSESDSFDAGDYSFSYLSKQGFINALNELRTRLTTANQVDPVEFSKWVLDQYTSTKIRYALNDRMTYKEDVVSWSKLTEIYITEKQNKA